MKRILIIEDDPAIQLGLTELLTEAGYEILKESDGARGLSVALDELPDLIILDIGLPSINGFEVCKMLREAKFNNPIIMLTSKAEQVDKVVGLEIGATDYVTKPFNSRELLARIRTQIRQFSQYQNSYKVIENTRRLATIMFTDIKSYSKMMNKNETNALQLLKVHNKILKKIISKFNGEIIEIIGDAFLVSFSSAVKAVECAICIQREIAERNKIVSTQDVFKIRIGIHLGDVVEFEGKLKGDVLNIASRIQEESTAGDVLISNAVYSAVKNKINFHPINIGRSKLKNIKGSVKLFKIKLD